MIYTASRASNTVLETLRLKYHNTQLVDQLASQLEEGEQTALLLNVHSEHYRFIMDYAQDIIYRSGRFIFINPAVIRLLGYHETEMLGHRALDLVHPHYRRLTEHLSIYTFATSQNRPEAATGSRTTAPGATRHAANGAARTGRGSGHS